MTDWINRKEISDDHIETMVSNKENIIDEIKRAGDLGMTPALAYDRVSSEEQATDGQSLAYQAARAQEYAQAHNMHIVEHYSATESGWKDGRKNFNRMLDIAVLYGIKDVIFKNIDRLGRNDLDWPRCKKLARTHGFRIHLYDLNTVFDDASTAEDEAFGDISSAFAKYHSNKTSQEIKKSYRARVKLSMPTTHNPPLGYTFSRAQQRFVIDEAQKKIAEYIFNEYLNRNIAIRDLCKELNARGFKTKLGRHWTKSTLHHMLSNPFYAGKFQYKGEQHHGNQELFISADVFEKVQGKLHDKNIGKRGRPFPFKGMLKSESKRRLTGAYKNGAHNSGTYIYYIQNTPYRSYRQDDIVSMIDVEIAKMNISSEYEAFVRASFASAADSINEDYGKEIETVKQRIRALESEQDRLLELIINSDMDKDAISRRIKRNRESLSILERQRYATLVNREAVICSAVESIEALRSVPRLWESATVDEKARFIKNLARDVIVYDDRVEILWREPFSILFNPELLSCLEGFQFDKSCAQGRTILEPVRHAVLQFQRYLAA